MNDRVVRRVVVIAFIIWVVWFFHPFLAKRMMIPWVSATVGQWGDSFGALNALMSTLAFAAVFYTLRLQQRQIDDTQRDQHIQRFESSYFELMRLFREARAAINFSYSKEYREAKGHKSVFTLATFGGDEAFRTALLEMRYWIQESGLVSINNKNRLAEIYIKRVHIRYEGKFGPYFRLMYTILQRISQDEILSEIDKARYRNLLRSQISSHEAAIAALNGLSPVSKDFSRLIAEFHLLKYLPSGTTRRVLEKYYPPEAFSARD